MRQNVQPAMQSLLFVQEGECSVTLSLESGEEVTVATLKAPFYIGWCPLCVTREPRTKLRRPVSPSLCHARERANVSAGEVGLLTGVPPTATVTVLSPTLKAYVLRRNYVLERNLGDNSMFKVMERKMEVRKFERLHAKDGLFVGCVADNAFVRSLRLFTERTVFEDGANLEAVTQSPGSVCRSASELGAPEEKEGNPGRAAKMPTTPSEMSAWFAAHVEFALEVREYRTLDVAIGSAMIVEVRRPPNRLHLERSS